MSRKKQMPPTAPVLRCAIYTRKSTEEGLEQEFNSLDAQRDAGEAYIRTNVFPCFCSACQLECAGNQYCGGTATITTTCSTCVANSLQGSCAPWINACMADVGCKAYYTCASGCQ